MPDHEVATPGARHVSSPERSPGHGCYLVGGPLTIVIEEDRAPEESRLDKFRGTSYTGPGKYASTEPAIWEGG